MNPDKLQLLMVAAENDVIPGAKVGGIGDVIRDLPQALAQQGHVVHVVIPAYGAFHRLPGTTLRGVVRVRFRQSVETIECYEVLQNQTPQVRYWVMEHPLFSIGGIGQVYCNDPPDMPFASDANKFSLFSVSVCEALRIGYFDEIDILHLHDWHAAFIALLRAYDPMYQMLKTMPCIFSIHNLALQGIRPMSNSPSSLESWYPTLQYNKAVVSDPRWPDCVNPVAAAIRLVDCVHTVSPTYAEEIQQPNDPDNRGFHGGEGLERDLQHAASDGRLIGILNGCDYNEPNGHVLDWSALLALLSNSVGNWIASDNVLQSTDYLSDRQLLQWRVRSSTKETPQRQAPANASSPHIITSVGRLTEQKAGLLTYTNAHGQSVLERLLELLRGKGVFILLGSGDQDIQSFMSRIAATHQNFLFLNRYAQTVADTLYANGTLFLMPSTFEPCGISQMIAMKHGQPCLVHAVGGLKDTVRNDVDGFHFNGDTIEAQAENLIAKFSEILTLREQQPKRWETVIEHAREARFDWQESARQYREKLYLGRTEQL